MRTQDKIFKTYNSERSAPKLRRRSAKSKFCKKLIRDEIPETGNLSTINPDLLEGVN